MQFNDLYGTDEVFTRLKQLEYIAKYLRMKCLRETIHNAEDFRNIFNQETNTLVTTDKKAKSIGWQPNSY